MKVLCYVDGEAQESDCYETTPGLAAQFFVEDRDADPDDGPVNIVTEPLDEEAGALPGWTLRTDGSRVRLFRVTPVVSCEHKEVQSFDVVPS
jgi:hypothetical protein